MVKIQLLDINDNAPTFTVKDYNVSLKEGRISNEPIIAVVANDADSGRYGTVTYRIVNGNDNDVFRIDRSTGEILIVKPALLQSNLKFDLEVSATDGGGLSATQPAEVHITVLPSGTASTLFDKPRYNFRVKEDVRVGTVVGNLKATLGDRGKKIFIYKRRKNNSSLFKTHLRKLFLLRNPRTGRLLINICDAERYNRRRISVYSEKQE